MRYLTCAFGMALAVVVLASSAHATETIIDVATMKDLRAAPLLRLADGTDLRLGLSTGGDAAGPWRMLYCLVEKDGDEHGLATSGPATDRSGHPERLGPLRYEVTWRGTIVCPMVHELIKQTCMLSPRLHIGAVLLQREGVAVLRVFDESQRLVAERELNVPAVRPAVWSRFARPLVNAQPETCEFVVEDVALPAMPRFAEGGLRVSATQPAAESSLPGELLLEPNDDPPPTPALRLTLKDGLFAIRSDKKFPADAPGELLACWWVNGQAIAAPVPKEIRAEQLGKQFRSSKQVEEATIQFGLPDFLGDLKPGDRVALRLLYSPQGTTPLIPMHLAQMIRQQQRDWPWPVMSNRIEFVLTEELLAKRDHTR